MAVINALSFDVEDWFTCLDPEPAHWGSYEDRITESTRTILAILARERTRATFFVLGWVAEQHPELVREIAAAGHEIASHGSEHRFVYSQDPQAFEQDVVRSLNGLTDLTNKPVVGYRAPYFSITERSLWALPILERLGFRYDSSIFPVWNHRYGIPDAPRLAYQTSEGLTEIPVSTFPLGRTNVPCCGGAYFRMLPWRLVTRWYRQLNDRGEPFVFYLHPWEVDPGHPRIRLPYGLKLRHYWGLAQSADKLAQLVRQFQFGPLCEVFAL